MTTEHTHGACRFCGYDWTATDHAQGIDCCDAALEAFITAAATGPEWSYDPDRIIAGLSAAREPLS